MSYFPQTMSRIFSKHLFTIFILAGCFVLAVKTAAQTPSLAERVFLKHQTILLSEDIQAVLPEVILELKKPENQPLLTPAIIDAVLAQPDLLKVIFPDIGDEFITLLKQEDSDVQILLSDPDVQILLQTPDAIDELIVLLDMGTQATLRIVPASMESPDVGEQFAIAVVVNNAQNIRGYKLSVEFDPDALRYVSWQLGTYLSGDVFAAPVATESGRISFVATAPTTAENTHGILLTLTFEVLATKASTLSISEVILADDEGIALPVKTEDSEIKAIPMPPETVAPPEETEETETVQPMPEEAEDTEIVEEPMPPEAVAPPEETEETETVQPMPEEAEETEIVESMPEETEDSEMAEPTPAETEDTEIAEPSTPAWDVNEDGVVNVIDLLLVTADFGQEGPVVTDVNGDNVVNILDLRLVANHLGEQYE